MRRCADAHSRKSELAKQMVERGGEARRRHERRGKEEAREKRHVGVEGCSLDASRLEGCRLDASRLHLVVCHARRDSDTGYITRIYQSGMC